MAPAQSWLSVRLYSSVQVTWSALTSVSTTCQPPVRLNAVGGSGGTFSDSFLHATDASSTAAPSARLTRGPNLQRDATFSISVYTHDRTKTLSTTASQPRRKPPDVPAL